MIYWYPSMPDAPVRFPYSQKQYQSDETYLQSLLETLLRLNESEFVKTNDEQRCKFCIYRSLCDRGIAAGQLSESEKTSSLDNDDTFEIDFDQIDAIVF
jgi:hypothetical protein